MNHTKDQYWKPNTADCDTIINKIDQLFYEYIRRYKTKPSAIKISSDFVEIMEKELMKARLLNHNADKKEVMGLVITEDYNSRFDIIKIY